VCVNPSFNRPSKQYIDNLATNSNGDIRSAITHLQFQSIPSNIDSNDPNICGFRGVDASITLFRLLGKILYNKRKDTALVAENQLHCSLESFKRLELDFNPEDVFCNLQMDAGTFALFLNQNYVSHCASLEEVVSASEYLSVSDLYLGVYEHNTRLNCYSIFL
jgi:cell cycle checkpoint protein